MGEITGNFMDGFPHQGSMVDQVIYILNGALRACISWFDNIMTETDMLEVWIALVLMAAVFSIILVPLRGGASVHLGGFTNYMRNKVNRHRRIDHDD